LGQNEIDAIRALLGSKPRPIGWSERRQRLDEVGSVWPVADDVSLEAVNCDGVPGEWSLALPFFAPWGAPLPAAPPCILHRRRPVTGADLQGWPDRVRAPQQLCRATTGSVMCNLYSMTKNQAAIRDLFKVGRDTAGNLPPLPAIFPDQMAPIVRINDGERELIMMRWGMGDMSEPRVWSKTSWLPIHHLNRQPATHPDAKSSQLRLR
jgi:hypothetical protein